MKKRSALFGAGLILAAVGRMQGQIVQDMTPDKIHEAIAYGRSAKNLEAYRLQEKPRFSWPPLIAVYTTPFLRVALAAFAAKKQYKEFTEADVTPSLLKPIIVVFAESHPVQGASVANVQTIILLPHNSKDPGQAIRPTETREQTTQYSNLFGYRDQGDGQIVTFPISKWNESYDLRVVFDKVISGSHGPDALGGCQDCRVHLDMHKIR